MLGAGKLSLVEIEVFVAAPECALFAGSVRTKLYKWVERLLVRQE